ncbi:MAG TPA: hypothetical protein PLA80_13535, partial [Synergistaceae bacterium]|nr:hypothetical protein [Synergistaceae bacterium]
MFRKAPCTNTFRLGMEILDISTEDLRNPPNTPAAKLSKKLLFPFSKNRSQKCRKNPKKRNL